VTLLSGTGSEHVDVAIDGGVHVTFAVAALLPNRLP
jgi:hypothetical protein